MCPIGSKKELQTKVRTDLQSLHSGIDIEFLTALAGGCGLGASSSVLPRMKVRAAGVRLTWGCAAHVLETVCLVMHNTTVHLSYVSSVVVQWAHASRQAIHALLGKSLMSSGLT